MKIRILACLFVLDNQKNENIKKNDIKKLKVLVEKDTKNLINTEFNDTADIKELIREKIKQAINSERFHLEQVYTLGDYKYYKDNNIDIIYIGVTNIENVKKLDEKYELVEFNISNNNAIIFENNIFKYKTNEKVSNNNAEYFHEIEVDDLELEKKLLELIIAYKYLRFRIDNTDICFKLLPERFTLEDVRCVYELIKDIKVDKSNFRKKISKFCEKIDTIVDNKGYRPTQMYKFNPNNNDIWL